MRESIQIKFSRTNYKLIYIFLFIVAFFSLPIYLILTKLDMGNTIVYILLSFSMWFILLIFFVKDLVTFRKIGGTLFIVFFMITNSISAYYLINIALTTDNKIFGIIILSFIGIFYGSFLWDFFISVKYSKYYTREYQTNLLEVISRYPIEKGIVYINQNDSLQINIKEKCRKIYSYIAGAFFIPFALLGKVAAYFLVLGISQYYSSHTFIIASILFPGTLFFIIKNIPHLISVWKLKYPLEKQIDIKK